MSAEPRISLSDRNFMDAIRQVETGGLADPWIRTKVLGSGSSAYGPYQVTKGLIDGALKDNSYNFAPEEKAILRKLSKQQAEALRVGGEDRQRFEGRLPQQHLDRFDYGGGFDFTDAEKAVLLGAQEKMLRKNLADAGGDHEEAARRWHGGRAWEKESKANPNPSAHEDYALRVMGKFSKLSRRDPRPQIVPQPASPEGKEYAREQQAAPGPIATGDPRERLQAEAAAIMAEEAAAMPEPAREYGSIVPEYVDPNPLQGPELGWALPEAPVSEPELRGPTLPFIEGAHGSPPAPAVELPADFNITLEKAPEWKMPQKRGMMLARKKADQARTRRKVQAEYRQALEAPIAQIPIPSNEKLLPRGLASMGPRRNKR